MTKIPECPKCHASVWQQVFDGPWVMYWVCYFCGTPQEEEDITIPPNIVLGEE